jgi:hypothetical protein
MSNLRLPAHRFEAFKRMQTNKDEPVDKVAALILFAHFNKRFLMVSLEIAKMRVNERTAKVVQVSRFSNDGTRQTCELCLACC